MHLFPYQSISDGNLIFPVKVTWKNLLTVKCFVNDITAYKSAFHFAGSIDI